MSGTGIVAFDSVGFLARYPEFATISVPTLTAYFAEAGLYLSNSGYGPVCDLTARGLLLNMITAHIAALYSGVNGATPSNLVGRIADATEGSVHVAADMGVPATGTQAWFQQTTYGASVWAALAPYRRGRYVPAPFVGNYGGLGAGFGGYGGGFGYFG
jgi:hypothetical protein